MTAQPPRYYILGAAGHVDHGKTALITALTGVNTDRLKEEQERGISIELGFAEFPLGDDILLGVVDMPGHERFVRQMVAGSGGVDLAFLVIAADEGVMPQTVEHLDILNSLGVSSGIVVLSKIDLVDEEIVAVAAEEARDLVADTFLDGKPMVPVSAVTGEGLEELREVLAREAAALPVRKRAGAFRLPVDRVFSLPGIGVIVTGTCWSGAVRPGDRLIVQPSEAKVRVREVQAHGRSVPEGGSGQRLALALHGVKRDDLERGYQVVTPDCCATTRRIDVRVNLLPAYSGVLKNRQRLHVHHAGREVLGRIVLLDEAELGGDSGTRTGLSQLHLEAPLVARNGDRLVLRFYSPVSTIAGGVLLDYRPGRHKRFAADVLASLAVLEEGDPVALFRQTLREAGLAGLPATAPVVEAAAAAVHVAGQAEGESASHGEGGAQEGDQEAIRVGDLLYHRDVLTQEAAAIAELLATYRGRHPLRLGIPKEEARRRTGFPGGSNEWNSLCQVMADPGGWRIAGDKIVPQAEEPVLPAEVAAAVERRESSLRRSGLQWPGVAAFREENGVPAGHDYREEEFLRHLVDRGHAIAVASDYFVHSETFAGVVSTLRRFFRQEDELSFARFRELTGLTRKLGIPLLEYLDQTGITIRVGDTRKPGPGLEASA